MDVSDSTHTHQRSIGADQTTVVALPKPEAIRLQMMMMIINLKDGDDDGDYKSYRWFLFQFSS